MRTSGPCLGFPVGRLTDAWLRTLRLVIVLGYVLAVAGRHFFVPFGSSALTKTTSVHESMNSCKCRCGWRRKWSAHTPSLLPTMSKDSYPKYPYGHDPPQEILNKVQELDTCEKEIVHAEHRLQVLREERKELDQYLAEFRASIAPISRLPPELLCLVMTEVVGEGDYQQILRLSLVCRAWRRAAISTPQLWVTIPIVLVNDMDAMVKQHRMIQVVLERNKTQPLDVSIDFTSFEPLQDYLASCIEQAFPNYNESIEIAEWLAISDWQNMPVVGAVKTFHRNVFDALVGLSHENASRWRSLHIMLPWEESANEIALPVLEILFSAPESNLIELDIDGLPSLHEEEDFTGLHMPRFVALQHLRCARQFDLSTLDISTSTLRSLDCTDALVYRNLQQIHQYHALDTLSYCVYSVMEPPASLEKIALPLLQRLHIGGAPHKEILDIFSVPHLSVLSIIFHKDFYVNEMVPQSDLFSVPLEVIWTSDDSFPMNDEMLYSLVGQCTSATNIVVEDSWKELLAETIQANRLLHPGELALLRTIEGCNKSGERVGDPIDVSTEESRGSKSLAVLTMHASNLLTRVLRAAANQYNRRGTGELIRLLVRMNLFNHFWRISINRVTIYRLPVGSARCQYPFPLNPWLLGDSEPRIPGKGLCIFGEEQTAWNRSTDL
jgi:F-box-like